MPFQWDSSPSVDQKPLAEFILRVSEESLLDDWVKEICGELLRAEPRRKDHFGYEGGDDWIARRLFIVHDHLRELASREAITYSSADSIAGRLFSASELLRERRASCAQAAALLCAVVMRLDLHPVFFAVGASASPAPTHAIMGVWLEDRGLNDPISGQREIEPHIPRLLLMDATGVLAGVVSASAENAHANGIACLPQGLRDNAWRWRERMSVPFRADNQIFYCVDIRAYQRAIPSVITLIGTNGGVGKTTISGCIAECIASTEKRPVVMVDLDIEAHTLTSRHLPEYSLSDSPMPTTVEDHLREVSSGRPHHGSGPVPVRRPKSSHILCLPSNGSLMGDDDMFFGGVRNFADEWVRRLLVAASQCTPVAVIVDCRSAHAPEVSALCKVSTVMIVVAEPRPEFLQRRDEILSTHRQRLLTAEGAGAMFRENRFALCLNKCSPDHSKDQSPWLQGAIPENAKLREEALSPAFESYLVYKDVARGVARMLRALPLQHLPLRKRV